MFKLIVIGKNGKEESDFGTLSEAQAHFDFYRSKGYWGEEKKIVHRDEVPAVTVEHPEFPAVIENGIEITPAIPSRIEVIKEAIPAWDETVPAQFTWQIKDRTSEVTAQRVKKEGKKADRDSRVNQFENIDWSTIDTIAKLKAIVRSLVKEAIKDEE